MPGNGRALPFVFVTGGCRSGKSAYAQTLAEGLGSSGLFVATAEARDEEMRRRVELHRQARGPFWRLLETPPQKSRPLHELLPAEARPGEPLLLDCLTLWVAGRMADCNEEQLASACRALAQTLFALPCPVVVVSGEVGLGLVPASPEGRLFRDMAGRANQIMADAATSVVFMVSGLPLMVKGRLPDMHSEQLGIALTAGGADAGRTREN